MGNVPFTEIFKLVRWFIPAGAVLTFAAALLSLLIKNHRISQDRKRNIDVFVKELGGKSTVENVYWARRNGLDNLYDMFSNCQERLLLYSKHQINEADAIAYHYLKEYLQCKDVFPIDLELYKKNTAVDWLYALLELVGIYDKEYSFLKGILDKKVEKGAGPAKKDAPEQMINEIAGLCNDKKIGLLLRKIDFAPEDLHDCIKKMLQCTNRIICTTSDCNGFVKDLIANDIVEKHIITPLDYFSFVLTGSQEFGKIVYLGDPYSPIQPTKQLNKLKVATALLPETNRPLYEHAYMLSSGSTRVVKKEVMPYIRMSTEKYSKPIHLNHELNMRINNTLLRDRFKGIKGRKHALVTMISMMPCSIQQHDLKCFCDELKLSFVDAEEHLRDIELIYPTKSYKYVNVIHELRLIRKYDLALYNKIFADPRDESGETFTTCQDTNISLRMLIVRALMQRFHGDDIGYYMMPQIKKIALEKDNEDVTGKCRGLLNEYYGKYKYDFSKPTMALLYQTLRIKHFGEQKETLFPLCGQIFNKIKDDKQPKTYPSYFSVTYRGKVPIQMPYSYHWWNTAFCFCHEAGLELSLKWVKGDNDDLVDYGDVN